MCRSPFLYTNGGVWNASETKPLVVDVDGQVHELTGSAETQYTKWRALLRRIYASETGLIKGAD